MNIDFSAFVDSFQYMLKGMGGIFIITAVIVAIILLLNKTGKGKEAGQSND